MLVKAQMIEMIHSCATLRVQQVNFCRIIPFRRKSIRCLQIDCHVGKGLHTDVLDGEVGLVRIVGEVPDEIIVVQRVQRYAALNVHDEIGKLAHLFQKYLETRVCGKGLNVDLHGFFTYSVVLDAGVSQMTTFMVMIDCVIPFFVLFLRCQVENSTSELNLNWIFPLLCRWRRID